MNLLYFIIDKIYINCGLITKQGILYTISITFIVFFSYSIGEQNYIKKAKILSESNFGT